MQRILTLFCCILPLLPSAQLMQEMPAHPAISKWVHSAFAKGKIPPFSFTYGGRSSSAFISGWKWSSSMETSADPSVEKYLFTYTDPTTQLEVRCHVTGYPAFEAVEWTIDFINTATKASPVIEKVNAGHYVISYARPQHSIVHYALGSNAQRSDFRPMVDSLSDDQSLAFAPKGGRSSNTSGFPFFNIETREHKGIVLALGWTGTWFANISQHAGKSLSIECGMKGMQLFLYPKESIRTPTVCILFWRDTNSIAGNNRFRQFLLAHHSRMIDGKFAQYPLSAGFQSAAPAPCNENSCLTEDYALAIIHKYKQFNMVPELFWLDAGWYTGSGGPDYTGKNWYTQVGNWTVDTTRFPHGLRPLSDAAHKAGAKFMLWFEPERVRKGSAFARDHPEWMLDLPGNDNLLFDLGKDEARQWLANYISKMITENGLDYYRQDFNMDPAPYWEAHDEPNRQGIHEIRHIEGLYAFWDTLLARFPRLLIDNCASGGRRLDLETTSRSAPLWRTDYQYGEPNGYQCHTYGLGFWLPLNGTGAFAADTFTVRSSMSSAMVMNWSIGASSVSLVEMQREIAQYKKLRPYFYEDFYPLTGTADLTGDSVWLAYQLHKPSDSTGMVVGFRRKDSFSDSLLVHLQGLKPDLKYEVLNDNDATSMVVNGRDLLAGFVLHLNAKPSSILLTYRPAQRE